MLNDNMRRVFKKNLEKKIWNYILLILQYFRNSIFFLVLLGFPMFAKLIHDTYKSIQIKTNMFSERKFNNVEYLLHEDGFHWKYLVKSESIWLFWNELLYHIKYS